MTGAEVALAAAAAPEVLGATAVGTGAALGAGATASTLAAAGADAAAAAGLGGGTAAMFGAGGTPLAASLMPMAEMSAAPAVTGSAAMLPLDMVPYPTTPNIPMAMEMPPIRPDIGTPASMPKPPWANMANKAAMNMGKGLLQDQQQPPPPAQRPPQAGAPQSNAEILQRLRMMQGPRSNFGGLLAQAMGR